MNNLIETICEDNKVRYTRVGEGKTGQAPSFLLMGDSHAGSFLMKRILN